MPSNTPNKGFYLPDTLEDGWDDNKNKDWQILDQIVQNIPNDGDLSTAIDNEFGQSLSTTSDVSFASVNTDRLSTIRFVDNTVTASDLNTLIQEVSEETPEHGKGIIYARTDSELELSGVELRSNVFLHNFVFKLPDGANDVVVKTHNFDTLTGTNAWFVDTENVPYNFGMVNCVIKGNRLNQSADSATTSSDGLPVSGAAIFGKGYEIDIEVHECRDIAFYTETGDQGGQHDTRDLPECVLNLTLKGGNSDGLRFRGPHDGRLDNLVAAGFDGYGIISDYQADTWNGDLEIDYLHSYSTGNGQEYNANIKTCDRLIIDNEPCVFNNSFNVSQIALVNKAPSLRINGAGVAGVVKGRCTGSPTEPGVYVNSGKVKFGQVYLQDWPTDQFVIDANNVTVESITSTGSGGYGLKLGDTGPVSDLNISFKGLNDNGTAGLYYEGGQRNRVTGTSFISSGNTGWDSTGSLPGPDDDFDILFEGGGSGLGQTQNNGRTQVADGGVIAHNLLGSPRVVGFTTTTPGHIATESSKDATNIGVSLVDDAGSVVGTAEPVNWWAEL